MGYGPASIVSRNGGRPFTNEGRNATMPAMSTFVVVAHRFTPTNTRLGTVLSPAQALGRLGPGDIALGRLDVLAHARRGRAGALGTRAPPDDGRDAAERAAHARRRTRQAPHSSGAVRRRHPAPARRRTSHRGCRNPGSSRRSSSSLASARGDRTSSAATTRTRSNEPLPTSRRDRGTRQPGPLHRSSSLHVATTCGW